MFDVATIPLQSGCDDFGNINMCFRVDVSYSVLKPLSQYHVDESNNSSIVFSLVGFGVGTNLTFSWSSVDNIFCFSQTH